MKHIVRQLTGRALDFFILGVGVSFLLGYLGQVDWRFDLLSHFRVQYLVLHAAGLVIALALKKPGYRLRSSARHPRFFASLSESSSEFWNHVSVLHVMVLHLFTQKVPKKGWKDIHPSILFFETPQHHL